MCCCSCAPFPADGDAEGPPCGERVSPEPPGPGPCAGWGPWLQPPPRHLLSLAQLPPPPSHGLPHLPPHLPGFSPGGTLSRSPTLPGGVRRGEWKLGTPPGIALSRGEGDLGPEAAPFFRGRGGLVLFGGCCGARHGRGGDKGGSVPAGARGGRGEERTLARCSGQRELAPIFRGGGRKTMGKQPAGRGSPGWPPSPWGAAGLRTPVWGEKGQKYLLGIKKGGGKAQGGRL